MKFNRRLKKAKVRVVNEHTGVVECEQCGRRWALDTPGQGKRLPNGYWKCPNGCNEHLK